MSREVTRRIFSVSVLGFFAGCVPASLKAEMDLLKDNNLRTQRAFADLKEQVRAQGAQLEILERETFNKEYCRSGKNNEFNSRISQFVREVQKGIPGTCQQGPLQEALYFLRTQAYSNCFFRPSESIKAIQTARIGHLQKFLDPKWFHPSTTLLVLVQPEAENEASHQRGLELGAEFKKLLGQLAPGRDLRILGPHLLPCRLRSEVDRKFNGPMDIALDGEPGDGTPRIRIWCFRTDCA